MGVARGEVERPSVWIALEQSLDDSSSDIQPIQFYEKLAILLAIGGRALRQLVNLLPKIDSFRVAKEGSEARAAF